ncbi:hypothetical protein BZA77DRAFT_313528 [Pyronema omphalodes]|nr:hypothetical protein BZA77DRAFT_313528 [Pyronema omphalodes]
MTCLDGHLAVAPSDGSSDAEKTFQPESTSRKHVEASDSANYDDAMPITTISTAINNNKHSLASLIDRPRKRVKLPSPRKNIHLPAEVMFEILACCSDGTLLNFARTSKAYNDVIQPMMIDRALEIPYNENFTFEYPMLEHHDRRCPLTCAIVNNNDVLLNNLIKKEYFPKDGLFHSGMGLAMTPLHWAIERQEYREQQFTGAIKKLLDIGFLPNVYDDSGQAPLHTLIWQKSVGEKESEMWHNPIIDMLIQHGAEVDYPTNGLGMVGGCSPLLIARLIQQDQSIIEKLISYGARD